MAHLEITRPGGGVRALTWDVGDGGVNVEVLTKCRATTGTNPITAGQGESHGVILRASGETESENGYVINFRSTTATLYISKLVNGSYTQLGSAGSVQAVAHEWWWLRARAHGNTISVKAWKDGEPEPETWMATVEDLTTPHLSGWVGIWPGTRGDDTRVEFAYFSLGVGGTGAPDPE